MDLVYLMLNEKGQTEPVQLVNASGVPQPLDASDPLVARLNTGPGSGRPVRLPKEHNEFVEAMELTEYHYYVDENNKVIPIPPGSIIQGEFEDEEEEDDNMDHNLQENDQLKNDLAQVQSEIAQVAGETELPGAKANVNLEEEVVPCSVEEQELAGMSEPAEAKVAKDHPDQSYGNFGNQEHSGVAAVDETGDLGLENASETIFTQDEIELEEEVVSLQISEPELVAVKPSAKYSKRSSIFTGHHDLSSSTGKCTDAGFVGELQTKSALKKSKRKVVGGTVESQASAVERVPLQPARKIPHSSVEPYASPSASESSVSDTGRPKRSVPRRSVLEMLHGEGKARKPYASSGSDSEVDGASVTQHSGKRRSKGAEKKASTAEKLVKTPLLSKTECKNEAQLNFTSQGLQTVNADQKCDETVELNSVSNLTIANVQSPVFTPKRGKGRPRKGVRESPKVVETPEMASAMQKDFGSVGSVSSGERRDDAGQQVTFLVEKESSKTDMVVTSETDLVSTGIELSDSISNLSVTALSSKDSADPAFTDLLKPDGREIKAEVTEVFTSDIVCKAETSASPLQKPLRRGRGRPKSTGERKMSAFESPKNAEEMDKLSAEGEASVFKNIAEVETETGADKTPEHLLLISEAGVERSKFHGDLRSGEMAENGGQVTRIVAEDLDKKEGHLVCCESSSLIHTGGKTSHPEGEEESSSRNVLKEEYESNRKEDTTKDMCDDSTASDHALYKEVNDRQSDEGSNTVEVMTQEREEHLVLDEAVEIESELAAVESDVCNASDEVENTVTHQDAWQLAKANETIVEAEMCYANLEDNSYLFEGQPVNVTDTSVEMPEELPGDKILEVENEQASVGTEMNHEAIPVDTGDVLCSEEKHSPSVEEEEEEDANLDHQVHDEEDIQDFHREMYFDHDSAGEPEAAAAMSSNVELVGEERSVDSTQENSQLTKSLLKHLQSAVELGKKKEMEPALKEFEESVLGLDVKAALLVTADLEQLATKIRCRLAYQETGEDIIKECTTSQLARAPEDRVRRLVATELMKLRALDQELDKRHSQLMIARGQLNRSESDVKQREQRLERSQMLLDLEKEELEEDKRKLLKEKESIRKERKLYAKLKENKKRKAETDTELSTSSKKVRAAGPVSVKERRPIFEEITAIKEVKTPTDSLQAVDNGSLSESQSASFQKQISLSADECESKASVQIDSQKLPEEAPTEKSCVKADLESEAKSCIQRSDVPLTPSGVSTVVKGKKELLRRFEADELNSPGDEQKSNNSLSHKTSEDDQKPNKFSSHKLTADEVKPSKSSSLKPAADDQKPNKSSSRKLTTEEAKPYKSSSHKPTKLETSSAVSSSVVKKSDQPSSRHNPNPALSLTPFECFLNQNDSAKSNKDILPIASSSRGTSSKSHSGKRSSLVDSERHKDLPSSPNAKKQHMDETDVQDSTESSSKSGQKDDVKRLSTHSDSSSKKRDYKQRKRIPAV